MAAPLFMCVAGEVSGDNLGGGLILALKNIYPDAQFIGIGGEKMQAAGLQSCVAMEKLSIMGLVEVIKHLPELFDIKKQLITLAQETKPIAYIGIDAPDFNLRVAKEMKAMGITTFHYVSPSIWVWRESRVFKIKKAIDKVLCLLPFEPAIYEKYQVDAQFIGHSLADEIELEPNPQAARQKLQLDENAQILAILPGSRMSEVSRLMPVFCEVMQALALKYPSMQFLIPAATPHLYEVLQAQLATSNIMNCRLFHGQSRDIMQAANAVLLASGTASLEAALLKKPQVVCYKFNAFTAWLAPKIVKVKYFSLPNLLSGREIIPECYQNQVNAEHIVPLIEKMFEPQEQIKLFDDFMKIHQMLRQNASVTAAEAIAKRLNS